MVTALAELQPLMEAGTFAGVALIWLELKMLKLTLGIKIRELEKRIKTIEGRVGI